MKVAMKYLAASSLAVLLSLPVMAQSTPAASAGSSTQAATPRSGGGRYDQQIQQDVTKELQKHDWAKNVRVSVEDSIVTLEGNVPLYVDKVRAYDKIHNKDHVQGVRNMITVAGPNVPDQQLQQKLADKLRYDRVEQGNAFNAFAIGVKNGVVTIAGDARTPVDAESALALVGNTPGVKDVIDDVKVLPVSPGDDDLRLEVARSVYGYPNLQKYAMDPQRPIRIIVDHGHVTLYGVVDSQADKNTAEIRAKSVSGVFSVTDKLMVAGSDHEQAKVNPESK